MRIENLFTQNLSEKDRAIFEKRYDAEYAAALYLNEEDNSYLSYFADGKDPFIILHGMKETEEPSVIFIVENNNSYIWKIQCETIADFEHIWEALWCLLRVVPNISTFLKYAPNRLFVKF